MPFEVDLLQAAPTQVAVTEVVYVVYTAGDEGAVALADAMRTDVAVIICSIVLTDNWFGYAMKGL